MMLARVASWRAMRAKVPFLAKSYDATNAFGCGSLEDLAAIQEKKAQGKQKPSVAPKLRLRAVLPEKI